MMSLSERIDRHPTQSLGTWSDYLATQMVQTGKRRKKTCIQALTVAKLTRYLSLPRLTS